MKGAKLQNIWFDCSVVKCQSLLAVRYRWTEVKTTADYRYMTSYYDHVTSDPTGHSSRQVAALCTHTPHYRLPRSVLHYFVLRSHTQRNTSEITVPVLLRPHATTTYYDVVYEVTLFHRFPLSKTLLSPRKRY